MTMNEMNRLPTTPAPGQECPGVSEANGLGAPPGPTDVAASPGGRTLVAGADDGIFGNVGLQWRRQDPGRSVAYP